MIKEKQKVMVAIDGSKEADLAFQRAIKNVKVDDAILYIAHIIDTRSLKTFPDYESMVNEQDYSDYTLEQAKNTLNDYKLKAKKLGVEEVETVLKYGSPKIEISESLPEEYNIDLLYLGSTKLNAVERIFIGSVSEYVIRHASCDVLIIRRNKQAEEFIECDK